MADTTVTIAASGADYTTIGNAATASNVTSGSWIMEIADKRDYEDVEGTVILDVTTGTPSATNRLVLTVDANNRHSGVHDLSLPTSGNHARWYESATTFAHNFVIYDDYVEISWFEICNNENADAALMINQNFTGSLVHHCLIACYAVSGTAISMSANEFTTTHYFDNCVILGGDLVFEIDIFGTCENTTVYIDHCSMALSNFTSGYAIWADSNVNDPVGTDNVTINMYNTWINLTAGGSIFRWINDVSEELILNGSHIAYGTVGLKSGETNDIVDNLTSLVSSYNIFDISTNDGILVTETTFVDSNFTPIAATGAGVNRILAAGTNRIGSEPYASQDFSVDVAGNTRSTTNVDIGAFQFSANVFNIQHWNGTSWVPISNIQHWNGTTWVDVTKVQHWNGTTWIDV